MIFEYKGLKGYKGLGALTPEERDAWYAQNEKTLRGLYPEQVEQIYNNQKFYNMTGKNKKLFNSLTYQQRVDYMNNKIASDTFDEQYKNDLGDQYTKYARMPAKYKMQLIEQNFKSLKQLQREWSAQQKLANPALEDAKKVTFGDTKDRMITNQLLEEAKLKDTDVAANANLHYKYTELPKLEKAWHDARMEMSEQLSGLENQILVDKYGDNIKDDVIDKQFQVAYKGKDNSKMKTPTFEAYEGHSELEKMSNADKREFLAKRDAMLAAGLPEDIIFDNLNDYAKDIIEKNQNMFVAGTLRAQDIGINTAAYFAQKHILPIAGAISTGRNKFGDKVNVWTDNKGNIISRDKIYTDKNGQSFYIEGTTKDGKIIFKKDENNNPIQVRQVKMGVDDLFYSGKDADGNDLPAMWNMNFWEKASMYNTLDWGEMQKAEKLGVSPHKVAYKAGDQEGWMMATGRMMSFGIVDIGETLLMSKLGLSSTGAVTKATGAMGKIGSGMAWAARLATGPYAGAVGIGTAYSSGVFNEALMNNLELNDKANQAQAKQSAQQWIKDNGAEYNKRVQQVFNKLKAEDQAEVRKARNQDKNTQRFPLSDKTLQEQAQSLVIQSLVGDAYTQISNSQPNADRMAEARRQATMAAYNSLITESVKYSLVNKGFRSWMYTDKAAMVQADLNNLTDKVKLVTNAAGKEELVNTAKNAYKGFKNYAPKVGKSAIIQFIGGAWTNFTDEMQSDAAIGQNSSAFGNYLLGQANGEALNNLYGDTELGYTNVFDSMYAGFKTSAMNPDTWQAGFVGGAGSFLLNPIGVLNIPRLRKEKAARLKELDKLKSEGKITDKEYKEAVEDLPNFWDNKHKFKSAINLIPQLVKHGVLSNGVAQDYYAEKEAYNQLNTKLKGVNQFLNDTNLEAIKGFYETLGEDAGTSIAGEEEAKSFAQALHILNFLENHQASEGKEPTLEGTLLSKSNRFNDALSAANEILNAEEGAFDIDNVSQNEEMVTSAIRSYYAANPTASRTEENDERAIELFSKRATQLQQAKTRWDKAEKIIAENEKYKGLTYDKDTRTTLKFLYAINDNNKEELKELEKDVPPSITELTFLNPDTDLKETVQTDHQETESYTGTIGLQYGDSNTGIKIQSRAFKSKANSLQEELKQVKTLQQALREKRAVIESTITNDEQSESAKEQKLQEIDNQITSLENRANYLEENRAYYEEKSTKLDNLFNNKERSKIDAYKALEVNKRHFKGKNAQNKQSAIDAAIQTVLDMDSQDRAMLINSIESDIITRRASETLPEESKPATKYNNENFELLQAVYNTLQEKGLIDKIKRHAALERETNAIDAFIDWGIEHAEAMEYEMQGLKDAELNRAASLFDAQQAEAAMQTLNLRKKLGMAVRPSLTNDEGAAEYGLLFNYFINRPKEQLNYIYNNRNRWSSYKAVVERAKDFKDSYDRIIDIATTLDPSFTDQSSEEAKAQSKAKLDAFQNALIQSISEIAPIPNGDNVIMALHNMKDTYEGTDIANILDTMVELDNQNNSTRTNEAVMKAEKLKEKEAKKKAKKESKKEPESKPVEENKHTEQPEQAEGAPEDNITQLQSINIPGLSDLGNNTGSQVDTSLQVDNDGNPLPMSSEAQVAIANTESGKNKSTTTSPTLTIEAPIAPSFNEEQASPYMTGSIMQNYEYNDLKKGKLTKRVPRETLQNYNDWLKAENINLEAIMEEELGDIFKENPNIEVHPMVVGKAMDSSLSKAHDTKVGSTIFNVIEYTPEVAKHHKDSNGGVIESNGKKYLIVGTLGYKNPTRQQAFINLRKRLSDAAFMSNNSRFYVGSSATHIVGMKGDFKIFQIEGEPIQERTITELVNDKTRNPEGLQIEDLKWGIVGIKPEDSFMMFVNTNPNEAYGVTDVQKNLGNVFLYIKSASGNYVPVKLNVKTLQDIKEGSELKTNIDNLLRELVNPDFNTRYNTFTKLVQLLFLSHDAVPREGITSTQNRSIAIGNDKNQTLTLWDGNTMLKQYNLLDPALDVDDFIQNVYKLNPRIQVTPLTLSSPTLVEMYSEAGALTTELAYLRTKGADYNVNAFDENGNEVIPTAQNAPIADTNTFREENGINAFYKGNSYVNKNNIWYDRFGNPINDVMLASQLELNYTIESSSIKPVMVGTNEYYIMNSDPNAPEVLIRDKNTHDVSRLSTQAAVQFIEQQRAKAEQAAHEQAASEDNIVNLQPVDIGLGQPIDANTGLPLKQQFAFTQMPTPDRVNQITEDSKNFELQADEKSYVDRRTGRHSARVSTIIGADKTGEPFVENGYKLPSTHLGDRNDEIVRDYLAGKVKESYANIPRTTLVSFLRQLSGKNENGKKVGPSLAEKVVSFLKATYGCEQIHLQASDIVAHGVVEATDAQGNKHKIEVAGTLDVLATDEFGNTYVLDMKTIRNLDRLTSNEHKWSQQTSLYQDFLANAWGLNIKDRVIIPTKLFYPTPEGERGKAPYVTYTRGNDGILKADGNPFMLTEMNLLNLKEVPYHKADIVWEKLPAEVQQWSREYEASLTNAPKNGQNSPTGNTGVAFSKMFITHPREMIAPIRAKWSNAPTKMKDLEAFLKEKGVNVDNIVNVDSFIDNINECK